MLMGANLGEKFSVSGGSQSPLVGTDFPRTTVVAYSMLKVNPVFKASAGN